MSHFDNDRKLHRKMTIVVNGELMQCVGKICLEPGLAAAVVADAMLGFFSAHNMAADRDSCEWNEEGCNLVILKAYDECELINLMCKALEMGVAVYPVRRRVEGGTHEILGIAIAPTLNRVANKIVANLPLL